MLAVVGECLGFFIYSFYHLFCIPFSMSKIIDIVYLLLITLQVVLVYYGWILTTRLSGETAITLPVPIGLVYVVIPTTGAMMLLICVMRIVQIWKLDSRGF